MFDMAEQAPAIPLPQSALFADAMQAEGREVTWHRLSSGPVLVLRRQLMGLGALGVVSRGAVAMASPPELAALRASLGLRHLLVSPETRAGADPLARAGFLPVAGSAQVAMLDLSGGPEAWLGRMHQKWRNRLRHGQKQRLVTERHRFCPDAGHWLFDADRVQQRTRRYRNIPHGLVADMARQTPGAGMLYLARHDRSPVAAMLFLRHGAMASYQIGWTNAQGQAASAHNLLLWTAMQDLAGRGHQMLDLGLLSPRKTPGIDRFKLGAGAVAQTMGGTWLHSAWVAPLHQVVPLFRGNAGRGGPLGA